MYQTQQNKIISNPNFNSIAQVNTTISQPQNIGNNIQTKQNPQIVQTQTVNQINPIISSNLHFVNNYPIYENDPRRVAFYNNKVKVYDTFRLYKPIPVSQLYQLQNTIDPEQLNKYKRSLELKKKYSVNQSNNVTNIPSNNITSNINNETNNFKSIINTGLSNVNSGLNNLVYRIQIQD